ncbi:putative WD40 repeat-like protein [Lyophyllum shimeji]|uniref:WD40 repeat-like protein n=1 Tax=Lyophyllum shimeji TaxID=47721 RepID=A0A9P3PI59_LYOSH|nr:putative WD40 repeat-like protein [Lyophyllum shimeji]
MAASTSRQPHQVPLPPSPNKPLKTGKKSMTRKGKGKENSEAPTQQPQVASDCSWDHLESDSNWEWSSITDPSASKVPPIFTKDGSYFFSLVGSSVKIHSVATGQVVSTLSAPRATSIGTSSDLLTAAILNPHNAFQLITGSLDGRLVVWDFLDAALLQIIDIEKPIHHICAHALWKDTVFVAASRPSKKSESGVSDDNAVVLRVSLKPVDNTTKSAEILPVGKTRFPTGLALSPSGAWLIATAGHKVYVASSTSLASGFTKFVSPERLTCLAFHPSEEYFATGDAKGHIRLWYCLNDSLPVNVRGVEKKTQTTALHWHAHAVSSIAFTSNGAYLLSGGEESVLVIWQLHTGKKEFVPRLGSPINTVSMLKADGGEEEYLLGLADATYLFVNSGSLKISRSYSRIKLDPAVPHESTSRRAYTPLGVHSLTSTLILPSSHPSFLQIYSPSSSKLVSELEVSPSNRVSRRDEKPLVPTYVEHAVISSSGEWLATIDVREADDGFRDEIYLKIWRWDQKSGRWTLNTRVDRPHGLKRVTCLAFSPVSKNPSIHLVTTGKDGNVKTWGLRSVKNKAEVTEEFWVTRSTFGFRSEQPRSAAWSGDASLFAVVFGPCVALYDPVTSALRQTLTSAEGKANKAAHFIGKEGRYLAVIGDHNLALWDLVSHSVRWDYKALWTIDKVVPHADEDSFAVFHESSKQEPPKTRVSMFRAASSAPSGTRSVPFRLRNLATYPFSRRSSGRTFVGITEDWSVVLFGEGAKSAKEEGSTATEIVSSSVPHRRTLFQDIFGKAAFAEHQTVPVSVDGNTRPRNAKAATDVFNSPAYLMAPLEHLFGTLMDGYLKPRVEDSPIPVVPEDEDVEMEEDTDSLVSGTQRGRVVSQDEMDAFVDLFKKHSVKSLASVPTNGHPTKSQASIAARQPAPNLTTPKNVRTPKQSTTRRSEAPVVERALDDATPSLSSAVMNGRKRKKSLS